MIPHLGPLDLAAAAAVRLIPPAWPLAANVAVNPFLGHSDEDLAHAAARLRRAAGVQPTPSAAWYEARIQSGLISDEDLAAALAANPTDARQLGIPALKAAARQGWPDPQALPTVAELAAEISGVDWPGLIADRLGAWLGAYFDEGQALWAAPQASGAYAAWRSFALRDLTPEIVGLSGFCSHVAQAPEAAPEALARACARLGITPEAAESAFHRLLTVLGGWGQVARYRLWCAEMAGGSDATATDLLTIRLLWEEALLARYGEDLAERWRAVLAQHAEAPEPTDAERVAAILQDAAERSAQRQLAAKFASAPALSRSARPAFQAAFCIDVRSEVFRRALEAQAPEIQTLGFAGFFGLTASHRRFASDADELRLPVLLNPGLSSRSGGHDCGRADRQARVKARGDRAWGRFKLAAISSFAFVEGAGPLYLSKLIRDSLGLVSAGPAREPTPRLEAQPETSARIDMAQTILKAMSLTEGFAPLIMLAGHGSGVVNNPHASALHCGACGGYSGEVNARLLAGLLNESVVRDGLRDRGIDVPADTLFVGALHDTASDEVTLFEDAPATSLHADRLSEAKAWLRAAGAAAREERAQRLPRARRGGDLVRRGRDWAQVRPEWGLAGCYAFIAAPRRRTQGVALEGRAFLHDYHWRKDNGFGVLELILTAPVVVASWISLQYYGSVVAPGLFGGGDKLIHNVVGGLGVIEGNGGLLRAGLPWQSVHDGETFVHEPLRLSVCIEAPEAAVTAVLEKHAGVRALFDNDWLRLLLIDEGGRLARRYAGGLAWEPFEASVPALTVPAALEPA
jgi:uncharacterized protein